ncbi:MAG: hypothetical protein AABX83_03810 [Nanoarchaeota archaeon]
MLKRGQFYFIAAFIIIALLSGLSIIYTSIKTGNENVDINEIVKEIRYEISQLIDNRVIAGVNDNQIADNIKEVSAYYKNRHDLDAIAVYGDESIAYIINSTAVTRSIPISSGSKRIVKLQLSNEYEFEMKENHKNLYVIALREKDGERAVAVE